MRAHILCVAHSVTSHEPHTHPTDAFVNTAIYMAELLALLGYSVYMYAVEGSVCACATIVPVVTKESFNRVYGSRDDSLVNTFSDTTSETWVMHNEQAASRIMENRESNYDIVLPMFGIAHKPCTDRLQESGMPCIIEPCIGHPGSYAPFRVYCSYSWMYTDMAQKGISHGQNYWCTIPHFLPPKTFDQAVTQEPYAVYLGRIQADKGVAIAAEACRRAQVPLKVAGNGRPGDLGITGVEYLGVLPMTQKIQLLAGAKCLFVPTQYVEPFSYACLEAQMTGTPVLCSRWGGPSEIVLHGRTGFHCDTIQSYCDALSRLDALPPREQIKRLASERFGTQAVATEFKEYFDKVVLYCSNQRHFYTHKDELPAGWGMGRLISSSGASIDI
jgi:glycosyltransferase involved in cell wall biosynthesis